MEFLANGEITYEQTIAIVTENTENQDWSNLS